MGRPLFQEIPMTKTLTKHGNSLALVIDKPILELLNFDADTPLSITTNGQQIIISRDDPKRQEKLDEAFEDTARKYDGMLKRLAQ
jgi:antitoxin component of MazEF toxin-antitoxin module